MNYKKLLKDFFMLTFSVLLAFSLNSWNENRKEKIEAQLNMDGIFEEIDQNIIALDTALTYHRGLLSSLVKNPAKTKLVLHAADITNEAWVLSENEIFKKHAHKELYKKIARAYTLHNKLVKHSENASKNMSTINIFGPYYMSEVYFDKPNKDKMLKFRNMAKQGWIAIFEDWCYYEAEYLQILKEIKSEYSRTLEFGHIFERVMSFVVSARKYRPQNFDELVGQDHIAQTLRNALKNDQLAHAFLFSGPRGVGKTTSARILAKVLNCQNLQDGFKSCGECDSCKAFVDNASFNIFELDAASNNSVEHIRALNEQVRFQPQQGSYKIYIIDEVHMLSQAAFNAFLKTLEEPPPYAKFILATTEKHKIIPTILSRCQIFDFRRIQIKDIVAQLKNIVGKEKRDLDDEALHLIAQKADGAMRDALSIYDKVVSSVEGKITYKEVAENLNVLDYEYYFKIVDAALKEDLPEIMVIFDDIVKKGFETEQFVLGLMEHLRTLLLVKDLKTASLLDVSDSLHKRYEDQAKLCSASFALTGLSIFNQTDINLQRSQNKSLSVEIALSKLAYMSRAVDKKKTESVIQKPIVLDEKEPLKKKSPPSTPKKQTETEPTENISEAVPQKKEPPKPTVKVVAEKVSAPKISSDINSLLASIEQEEKDKLQNESPFNKEKIREILDNYKGEIKSNSVKSAIDNVRIKIEDQDIKILAPTQIYLDFIKQELILIERIHHTYPAKDIKIFFQVSEETFPDYEPPKKPKHLTTKEKFEMLAVKNPDLKKLVKVFKLSLNNQ